MSVSKGKFEIECPSCEGSRIETEGLLDSLKDSLTMGGGIGLGAIALNIAALPAVIGGVVGTELYKSLKGRTVTCADCGHEWVMR